MSVATSSSFLEVMTGSLGPPGFRVRPLDVIVNLGPQFRWHDSVNSYG